MVKNFKKNQMIRIFTCLTPRLNYSYSLKDFWYSLISFLKSKTIIKRLNCLFETDQIYYVNHARTGLRMALNSIQLPQNARIGVQCYNCKTVFHAVKLAGFKPVFIDTNFDFQICLSDLEKKRNNIDALILTHTFGIPGEVEKVKEIIHNIPLIEDCAHSFLSKYKGHLIGKFGDIAVFSIGKGKFPSIGEGGFVIIINKNLVSSFKLQNDKLLKPRLTSEFVNIFKNVFLAFLHLPFVFTFFTNKILRRIYDNRGHFEKNNFKETKMLKTSLFLFSKKMQVLENILKIQKSNFNKLLNIYYLNGAPQVFTNKENSLNGFMFPIITTSPESVLKYFGKNGIELGRHFSRSIEWAEEFGYKQGDCPKTEEIVKRMIVFPCHYNYKKMDRLVKLLINYENIN